MTIADPRVRKRHLRPHPRQTMVPSLVGLVFGVRLDSYFKTEDDPYRTTCPNPMISSTSTPTFSSKTHTASPQK